ncbi:hypothetical protein PUNSTDRAFT_118001 [Punctularia strigosozonata HHB-11173 SS5]|uniref:uncharacterized protein n=1 Tax=Punctularia strigosozonata (strain HHB-11173) TaxID=741275 RepID=UPI000441791A|nr:uncharacterized protein PUNSTDRAFT_118001 [Punctularia strigosozonata HHB-11173 SS5]EIN14530.1 hypothetical protein PUNSTDRAFT_118001 [Punctularia strigosozonata HHB-11173 SS5]
MGSAPRRLNGILSSLSAQTSTIGTLKLGDITLDITPSATPSRLPHLGDHLILDVQDNFNLDNLHFLLQKYLLGQDVFLLSQPGPYARRLVMTFCRLINTEYEHVALHRDVGETELKQGREIKAGGTLNYVDSATVRAAKYGRILILEGIEKAERGIMPLLNNLLENREMNLEDGTHIVHPHRRALMETPREIAAAFIPAHKNFRVIAIGAPVPPFPGYPLDPPFRSRFQARFIDPVGATQALVRKSTISLSQESASLVEKLRGIILATQLANESHDALQAVSRSTLPPFPQTAIAKLTALATRFPAPAQLSPAQMARLILTLHPSLLHAPFQVWALLSRQMEEAGISRLGSPASADTETDIGLLGYRLAHIERDSATSAKVHFQNSQASATVICKVAAGSRPFRAFPLQKLPDFLPTGRFLGLLTCLLQGHALDFDMSFIPPAMPSTASCSTSLLVRTFSELLGYDMESIHLYKDLGGRELVMRRHIAEDGSSSWEPSPLISASLAKDRLIHLEGTDAIGSTAGSLARLLQDRELELWHGKRIVAQIAQDEATSELAITAPSLRIISTPSKSVPLRDWLTIEHANMFFPILALPMGTTEETQILLATTCPTAIASQLVHFAQRYRERMTSDVVQKNRKLGTRSLIRITRRLPWDDDLHSMLSRAIMTEFMPSLERLDVETLMEECGILKRIALYNPAPVREEDKLIFPAASGSGKTFQAVAIARFNPDEDPEGVSSYVPHVTRFHENSLQSGLMREMAIDLELLGEHLVLLGNQGVGKNAMIDKLLEMLGRPREYMQLHRDSTVSQIMLQTTVESGVIRYQDSPLLRGIKLGRVVVVDEADKAPEHVVAVFRSLAAQGEMSLPDGRRISSAYNRPGDIVLHPNFRLVLLANRPGYPFLGNHFLQVLGDNFSLHAVMNPDIHSERRLLSQLAPELDEDLMLRLIGVFHDLRRAYEINTLTYPYSLRELINLVRHLQAYPEDSLETSLRNVFDFDVAKPETVHKLAQILQDHGLSVNHIGLHAARDQARKKVLDLRFDPKGSADLDKPNHGKDDPNNEPHIGGNTWAGGVGGRDTAGLGGRGGYMRLFKGHDVYQVSDQLKNEVPEQIKEQARDMARQELARRLEELNMSTLEAKGYAALMSAVEPHIVRLHDLLENLAAREEERVWVKRQTDGELDESRLTEGLTGEATVYKRRGVDKPELGRPQIKPKRIRFLFDLSGSMYRFQNDGRLRRSLETAVMLMESLQRIARPDKYAWDIYGHSGDGADIPLVELEKPPADTRDRWKVVEKMNMITQYAFAGDHTVEAIEKAVTEVAKYDADEWIVVAITDANFARYNITPQDLKRAMDKDKKVNTALICIGESSEAAWVSRQFPGRAFNVANTQDIPAAFQSLLSRLIDR